MPTGFAGGRGIAVEVAAERLQPDLVGEVGERELAQLLRGGLTRDPSAHDTRLAHRHVERARRDDDGGDRLVSIKRDELSGGAGVERARAGVERVALRAHDLEPAPAAEREIELVAGGGQRALRV